MSSIDHLHAESMILPVRRHNELLSRQFLLGAHLPDRPDNFVTKRRTKEEEDEDEDEEEGWSIVSYFPEVTSVDRTPHRAVRQQNGNSPLPNENKSTPSKKSGNVMLDGGEERSDESCCHHSENTSSTRSEGKYEGTA